MTRVAIAGAGIGGLYLARCLRRRGIECVVFEALDRTGGVLKTIERDGRILEAGPQRTRLTPVVRTLTRDLDLDDEVVTAPANLPLFVYRDGALRRAPLSFADLFRTDLLGPGATLRVLLEPFTAGPRTDETVARYLTRRFGTEAYTHLLGPLFGGLYASDPADMLVRHALGPTLQALGTGRSAILSLARRRFRTPAAAPAASFRSGLRTLTDALYARVADVVQLGAPVLKLRRDGDAWVVHADTVEWTCDHVVLTTPAPEAARILADAAPEAADRLARLRYNRLAVVHMDSDADLHGLGFQTSFAESLETRGVTFNHALFGSHGRRGLYTAFLGGARDPALPDRDDDAIGATATREFRTVTGHDAAVLAVSRTSIPAWDRTWTHLEDVRLPPGIHLCANYESRVGIAGRIARAEAVAATLGGAVGAG